MDNIYFIIAILATWRLSAMLSYEAGLFNIFEWSRELTGIVHDDEGNKIAVPETFFAKLLDCVWCISVWIGLGIAIVWWVNPVWVIVFLPFALSTGAIIIEKLCL